MLQLHTVLQMVDGGNAGSGADGYDQPWMMTHGFAQVFRGTALPCTCQTLSWLLVG
jgi:hypothetical protein